MKKLALMIYPNFSMQEISSICGFFKWELNCETEVFSSSLNAVNSEEGILVKPSKTLEEFSEENYHCLILPGCSDYRYSISDYRIKDFLQGFNGNQDFVIGAICSGPLFLAQAGLLDNKKFTSSMFVEMLEWFTFIKEENVLYQPVVVDGNIVTAVGFAFNEFALAVATRLGFECPEKIYAGVTPERLEDISIYKQHLPEDFIQEFKKDFSEYINIPVK